MPAITFKTLLQSGSPILGTFLQIPAAEMAEIVACAGFQAAIVDCEHGMLGLDSARQLLRGCDAMNIASIYRVPRLDHQSIGLALDLGTSAVMVPNISTADEARQAVQAAKYHPAGSRGICLFTRGARYNALDTDPDFYRRSNRETALILQVEGAAGLANLESILEVPEVDCLFVGPFDLSQSLGIPGQVTDARVLAAIEKIVRQASPRHVAVGNFAVTLEQAEHYFKAGVRFVAYATDTLIAMRAFTDVRRALGKLVP